MSFVAWGPAAWALDAWAPWTWWEQSEAPVDLPLPLFSGGHGRLGARRQPRRIPDDIEDLSVLLDDSGAAPLLAQPGPIRRRARAVRDSEWLLLRL